MMEGAYPIAWPPLISGVLLRRYKRFLADARLDSGETVTMHCANSGRMTACCEPGRPVYLSRSDDPRRRLRYTWELIRMPDSLVGVNTQVPNRLVAGAIAAGAVPELAGYGPPRREVSVSPGTRLDILLERAGSPPCFVEVKNCTLVRDGEAAFPDAVTERGRKHLEEMTRMVREGVRCVMFFLIQRMDAAFFLPADDIDPDYGQALRRAARAGVELLPYDVHLDPAMIRINRRLPLGPSWTTRETIPCGGGSR